MSRQEAAAQYAAALKQGRKAYKEALMQGRYPYPQVLDEIISDAMVAGQTELGVLEIPADQIVGTKTAGRRSAFSTDFMPLLDADTEFAGKWMSLCEAHLGDEGIRDPIRCYEYFGRFYVQEGNKRVSVLRSYGAPTIPAYVIRMVPVWTEEPAVAAYYDFMQSFPKTGVYRARFSRAGSFVKLQKALGYEPDHVWTEDERRRFLAGFTYFQEPFRKLGGDHLPITTADALLVRRPDRFFLRGADQERQGGVGGHQSPVGADCRADGHAGDQGEQPSGPHLQGQTAQPPERGLRQRPESGAERLGPGP